MALRIDTPDAAVAAAPYLIGFTPRDSLVLLLLDAEQTLQVSMRVDLPAGGDLEWMRCLLQGICGPGPEAVLLIAYADAFPPDHAEAVALWVLNTFLPAIDVVDVVVVAEGRFVTASRDETVDDPGRPLSELADHPVVAGCVAAGMTSLGDREELVAALEQLDDAVTQRVRRRLRESVGEGRARDRDALEERSLAVLLGREELDVEDVVSVALACRDVHVRDPLLALLLDGDGDLGAVRTRMVYCLRHTPGRYAGSVAATLALLCWADGDGAAALVAADRAMSSDPANTLAPLVASGLQNGLPPDTWSSLTADIPMEVLRGGRRRSA